MYEQLILKYKNNGLIIDTNLLLLFFVGIYDQTFIHKFKRTQKYTLDDFTVICQIANCFDKIIITPHILTEFSNLSFQMPKDNLYDYFSCINNQLKYLNEENVCKNSLIESDLLFKFGFTDLSIIEVVKKQNSLVLTDDFKLYGTLNSLNFEALNLNYIRTINWLK